MAFFHSHYLKVLRDFIQPQKQFCFLFTSQGSTGALLQKGIDVRVQRGPAALWKQRTTGVSIEVHRVSPARAHLTTPCKGAERVMRSQVQPSFQVTLQGYGDRAGSRSNQEFNPQVRSSECQAGPQRQRRAKVNMERTLWAGMAGKDIFKPTF